MEKSDILGEKIGHIDITRFDAGPIIDQYANMAFQAKNLARCAHLYDEMLEDPACTIILCLAGSLFSAGLGKMIHDLASHCIVDQDFFEALGFRHYRGSPHADDGTLMKAGIDRIYDTYISEDELRICDMTVKEIAERLTPKPHSSREFIEHMGRFLHENGKGEESVVRKSFEHGIPIFVPAFSDSSAGFGLVAYQWHKGKKPKVTIDSVKDFLELTKIKIASGDTGLFMIGGGVPKNFAQDVTVAADILGKDVPMHKYAMQITVADERDGGLSGSTLREAHSWGKVDSGNEQMLFCEATVAAPLIASYAYHRQSWKKRNPKRYNDFLNNGE